MKLLKIALWGVGVLLVAVGVSLAALLLVARHNPAYLEPLVERGATYFLGRELRIGELSQLSLATDAVLELRDLELANAPWAESASMLSVGHLKLVLNLPSLWQGGSIIVRKFELEESALELLAPEGTEPNWALPLKIEGDEAEDEPGQVLFPVIIEQARLSGVSVTFSDPDQHVVTEVQSLQLERDDSTGLSHLDLSGVVNELPLKGGGEIGPTAALQSGKNLSLDLSLEVGAMRIITSGSVADALALEGADLVTDISAPRSRAVLDMLGLEEVRDGPMEFRGRLADASPGLRVEMEGEMAGFGLGAHGVIAKPVEFDGLQLDFYLDGPSMAEGGAIFGLEGFRDVPYDIAGSLHRRGTVLKIEGGRFRAGQGQLSLSGVLPQFPEIDDWEADIEGRRLDLSVLGPVAGIEGLPQLFCDVQGKLSSDEQGVELVDLRITDGDVNLLVDGVVGESPAYINTAMQMRFTGNDLTRLQSLIGLDTVPAAPYELQGELSRDTAGWQISDGRLSVKGIDFEVSARLDSLTDFKQVEGKIRAVSPDVLAAAREYGVKYEALGALPVDVAASAKLANGGFEISDLVGDLGGVTLSGSGWISAAEGFAGSRLTLDGRGDNFGEALAVFAEGGLPGQPFSLSLDATYLAPLVTVDRLNASLGDHRLVGELKLEESGDQQLASGHVVLEGGSLNKLLAMAGLEFDHVDGSYKIGTDLEMTDRFLALENLRVRGVNSELDGVARLQFGDIPRLDMDLHSREVHVPSLFPALALAEDDTAADDEQVEQALLEVPTSQEMKDRLIPETELPLNWINRVNGRWRLLVDRAWSREDIAARLRVDIDLEGGVLKSREIAWGGDVSTGWIDLGIDARKKPYKVDLALATDRIPLLWLVAGRDIPRQKATYRASLSAVGSTTREAAASLDGALIMRASGAQLDNRGLDLVLGDVLGAVADRVNPANEVEQYIEVECLVGAMRANQGLVSIDPGIVMRTDKIDVVSHGVVDLGTEVLDISFNTRSRKGIGISAGKAITPYLKLAGNLANPWLTVDPSAVAISGTAAVATAGVSIIAESLYDRWVATSKSPCKELFKRARREPDYQELLAMPEPGLTATSGAPSIRGK